MNDDYPYERRFFQKIRIWQTTLMNDDYPYERRFFQKIKIWKNYFLTVRVQKCGILRGFLGFSGRYSSRIDVKLPKMNFSGDFTLETIHIHVFWNLTNYPYERWLPLWTTLFFKFIVVHKGRWVYSSLLFNVFDSFQGHKGVKSKPCW